LKPLTSSVTVKPRLSQKLLVSATALMLLSHLAFYLTVDRLQDRTDEVLKNPMNILVLGVDQSNLDPQGEEELPRTDTMLFLALRPNLEQAALFSIPRDSLIEIPGYGMERINMAHVYGGYGLTKSLVEKVMEMPVDRYILLNFECFQEIVDLVGGVEITVDKRMIYEDKNAGFKIDLQPGLQKLDGYDALGYVRFRRDALGDITRTRRQQQFMIALATKLKDKETFLQVASRAPEILGITKRYLQTDLNLTEVLGLYLVFKNLDLQENLLSVTLPGEFSGPYWRLHPREIEYLTEPFRYNYK
jgi:LCP family protein required for cell wall assembly